MQLTVDIVITALPMNLIGADISINNVTNPAEKLYSWRAVKASSEESKGGYWLKLEINPLLVEIQEGKVFLLGIEIEKVGRCEIDSDQCELTFLVDKLNLKGASENEN